MTRGIVGTAVGLDLDDPTDQKFPIELTNNETTEQRYGELVDTLIEEGRLDRIQRIWRY